VCPDGPECKDLYVKFGENENAIYMKGERISDDHIRAQVPKYAKPDVLTVEATFNGQDYTHDNHTYGFFDPYVLDLQPRLISTRGTTRVRLVGFGFVNAGDDLKTVVSHVSRGALQCQGGSCVMNAEYVDKNTIESPTFPQSSVFFKDNTTENIKLNGMAIEASVTGGLGYTENGLEIWYYEQPDVISLSVNGAPTNQQKAVFVKTDFKWNVNELEKIKQYGNFSCRFTSRDGKRVAFTKGRLETLPLGTLDENAKPTHIRCQNPLWSVAEEVRLDVTLNGQEFYGDFTFTFYEGIDLYRVAPMAGPNEGKTRVKLFGAGFNSPTSKEDVHVRWGVVETTKLLKDQVLEYIWNENDYI
jgi:hypothetical protein